MFIFFPPPHSFQSQQELLKEKTVMDFKQCFSLKFDIGNQRKTTEECFLFIVQGDCILLIQTTV